MTSYLTVDEDGFILADEVRIADDDFAVAILENLFISENSALHSKHKEAEYIIESFDSPIIVKDILEIEGNLVKAECNYALELSFDLTKLYYDEWHRLHGFTKNNISFVISEIAFEQITEQIDDYNDTQLCINDKWYDLGKWLPDSSGVETNQFWNERYATKNTGWELEKPTPVLTDMLPRLKLSKSKILVLGCGSGNDAAYFAEQGHIVTAVDFSREAIETAKKKYGHIPHLHFVELDIFKIPHAWNQTFDLIFEQTCYCAIKPSQRNDLVGLWKRMLHSQGFIMGVFFVNEHQAGPPFGGSEWEIRERLKMYFQMLFWGRWRNSVAARRGKELFIYAKIK